MNAELVRFALLLATSRKQRTWELMESFIAEVGGPWQHDAAWSRQQDALALHLPDEGWLRGQWAYNQVDAMMTLVTSSGRPDEMTDDDLQRVDGCLWHLSQATRELKPLSRQSRSARTRARDDPSPAWARTARPPARYGDDD